MVQRRNGVALRPPVAGRAGKQRAQRPLTGPSMCLRSTHLTAVCDVPGCGRRAEHYPLRLRGWWCSQHCPACSALVTVGPEAA